MENNMQAKSIRTNFILTFIVAAYIHSLIRV